MCIKIRLKSDKDSLILKLASSLPAATDCYQPKHAAPIGKTCQFEETLNFLNHLDKRNLKRKFANVDLWLTGAKLI